MNHIVCLLSLQPHRISVRSVTLRCRASPDTACTMAIGKEVPSAPACVRESHVTATSSLTSWLPANFNYHHAVCVNHVKVRTVKPGIFRHTISGLSPNTIYRVTVKAKNIHSPIPHAAQRCSRPAHRRPGEIGAAGRNFARHLAARRHQQPVGQVERSARHRLRRRKESDGSRQPHRTSPHSVPTPVPIDLIKNRGGNRVQFWISFFFQFHFGFIFACDLNVRITMSRSKTPQRLNYRP